jgi:2-iminoacetate synthase ThiH
VYSKGLHAIDLSVNVMLLKATERVHQDVQDIITIGSLNCKDWIEHMKDLQ